MKNPNRRNFVKQSGLAAAAIVTAPMIIQSCGNKKAPSDRINLAVIGAGNQGSNDTAEFLKDERVQITAVCDVNTRSAGYWDGKVAGREFVREMVESYYSEQSGKRYKGVREYTDFQEVLERNDIDAVLIALPDHWHSIPVMMAAHHKKDIYCQKPLTLTISEGRDMSNSVKKHNVILQTGSQQRSNFNYRRICELALNGRIGQIHTIRCGLPGGTPDFGRTGLNFYPEAVPKGFDFDRWLGPAPVAPYRPCSVFVNYRWVLDYSGGQVTDWGGHHPDIAQWLLNADDSGPVKIQNVRGSAALHPVWNTASEFYFECIYANGIKMVISNKERFSVTIEGTDGWLWASRENHEASDPSILESEIGENELHMYKSDDHYRNFIDCVYSREQPVAPVEAGHRSITISHLGNIAMMLKQDLNWDPVTEKITNNDFANKMLSRPKRAPWDKIYEKYKV